MNAMVPATVRDLFVASFGSEPQVVASAPGRVNLIGEHTDYNGGEVLPIAITQRTWVAMSRRLDASLSRVVSSAEAGAGEFHPRNPQKSGSWWDYISGIGAVSSHSYPAADIAVVSDVPAGAGLSSSAALEVAAGLAFAQLTSATTDMRGIALDAWRVETEFVGVECGIMDQFASALACAGHALHVWCDTETTENVPFAGDILVFDTAVPRSLRSSEFNQRRRECSEALSLLQIADPTLVHLAGATREQVLSAHLSPVLELRALHVVEETGRVREAVGHLQKTGSLPSHLLYESHESLRDKYQCSSPELDWFVARAMEIEGVEGARLTGAGWGGCAIACGDRDALLAAKDEISHDFERRFARVPRAWLTAANAGAQSEVQ